MRGPGGGADEYLYREPWGCWGLGAQTWVNVKQTSSAIKETHKKGKNTKKTANDPPSIDAVRGQFLSRPISAIALFMQPVPWPGYD